MRLSLKNLPSSGAGNLYSNNTIEMITIIGNTRQNDLNLDGSYSGVYYLAGDATFAVGTTVEMSGGVVWKMGGNTQMRVDGILRVNGTQTNPVVFTAYTDDSVRGDTNNDGTATTPAPGYWDRLLLNTGSGGSQLNYTDVRYAGLAGQNVYIQANAEVNNSSFTYSSQAGITIARGLVTFNNNLVEHNNGYGVHQYSDFNNRPEVLLGRSVCSSSRTNFCGTQARNLGSLYAQS